MRKTAVRIIGQLHRSSPSHTTNTTTTTTTTTSSISTAAARTHHTWIQAPRRRSYLPAASRVYPHLVPHHYYHASQQSLQSQQQKKEESAAPTPEAQAGTTPAAAAAHSTMAGEGVTGGPSSSTQAAPGSTQDGPPAQGANHAAPRAPAAPNASGTAAGRAADLRESAGEHDGRGGQHEGAVAAARGEQGVGGGVAAGSDGGGGGDPKALPPPSTEDGDVRTLEVDGKPISLDHMGPMVVHKDGTLSRISNWGEMTEIERQNTLRILVKRNQVRLGALRQGLQTEGHETK